MKRAYIYLLCLSILTACDVRSKYRKAADEIMAKVPPSANMNVGKRHYSLYIPKGWRTEHRSVYGVDYYFLFAPQTKDDPNTSINVITEYMQNLSLDEFKTGTIESLKNAIPSASHFIQGRVIANGLQGCWYSYTMAPQGIKAALICYIFSKDGVAYIITGGTEIKDASRYRSLFDSVATSFRFNE